MTTSKPPEQESYQYLPSAGQVDLGSQVWRDYGWGALSGDAGSAKWTEADNPPDDPEYVDFNGTNAASHDDFLDSMRAIKDGIERSQSYDTATQQVLDKFRDRVDTTWRELRDLRTKKLAMNSDFIYYCAHVENEDEDDTPRVEPLVTLEDCRKAAREFQAAYLKLLTVRDDPKTPFMTSRIIAVDTSVFGTSDDDYDILYHSGLITDPVVLREMKQNDEWYWEGWGSSAYRDSEEKALLRKDEQQMSWMHGRNRGEEDPAVYLLKYAGLYHYVNDAFGVDVATLTETARLQLVEFLADASKESFQRIVGAAKGVPEIARKQFAEAFWATEFGDDLGEAILSIAEKKGHEHEAERIFALISEVRDNLSDWESKAWFAQEGSEYREYFTGIRRAIEMRISQILSPVPDLMDGVSQDAQYFHRDETIAETAQVDSIDKVIQGLKLLSLLTEKIAAAEAVSLSDRVPSVGDDFSAASTLVGQSKVRVMMRPRENNASEARVRWTVTITPEEQMEIFGKYLDLNKQGNPRNVKISLRLDLEKISKMLSLDLGTRMDFGSDMREYPDRLLAALVTAGVQHSLTKQGRDILHTDYHVRDTFSEDLSRPERFAGFAELMIENYVDQSRLKRGKLGKHATRLSVDPESLKTDVVYTGLFFDDDSVKQLLDLLPAKYAHVPRHLHATIKYRPSEGLAGFTPGEGHTVKVVGVVDDGHAQALIVESTAMGDVKHPHITISTANDENGKAIPPSYSNHAIKQAVQNGTVRWLETPIELSATSGYLDGKSREIVTSV